jgi:hypothetical protein
MSSTPGQDPEMLGAVVRVDDVKGLVALFEPLLDERKQDRTFLVLAVEKRADVPLAAQGGSRQSYCLGGAQRSLL